MIQNNYIYWIYWNPDRNIFVIPYFNHPLRWYGLLFVVGFIIGYWIMLSIFTRYLRSEKVLLNRDILNWDSLLHSLSNPDNPLRKIVPSNLTQGDLTPQKQEVILAALNRGLANPANQLTRESMEMHLPGAIARTTDLALELTDRLTWYTILGTVIGARLGHVFFYEWPLYRASPLNILKVWEGGLASHGGTIGVILALIIFWWRSRKKFPEFSFINLLDMLCIPTAFVAFCIRMGNFMNQEILGVETSLPWAVVFGDPADGSAIVPRHPVQLYEGFAYLAIFVFLYALWKINFKKLRPGIISGLFFILVFGSRFLFEFVKLPSSMMIDESFLQTGQILSIPCIIGGFVLLLYGKQLSRKFN